MPPTVPVVEIAGRFEEMIDVLIRTPFGPRNVPSQRVSAWPDIIRSFWEAYGRDAAPAPRVRPTPAQQDRCDQAAAWLLWLDDEQRRLILLRAAKVRWRFIEAELGITRKYLHHRWFRALEQIAGRLGSE